MVCTTCKNMLSRQVGRFARGTLDIRYKHHTTAKTFQEAVRQKCYICRALFLTLREQIGDRFLLQRLGALSNVHGPDERMLLDLTSGFQDSKAFLTLEKLDHIYRLEIKLTHDQAMVQHTFHLECRKETPVGPDQRSVHVRYRTQEAPRHKTVAKFGATHHRNYSKALQWLEQCRCYTTKPRLFYPTRLISLKHLKASIAIHGNSTTQRRNSQTLVNLVETASWPRAGTREEGCQAGAKHYVTLSHCWGGTVSHRLLRTNYNDFIRGVPIGDLPKTFQDAIYFASAIDEVDYIWIDSLCIIQEDEEDWLKEAAAMSRVYSETYLNLSATAAVNSSGGLFTDGDFELMEEDTITLDIQGLPLAYDLKAAPAYPCESKGFFLRACRILDVSFWETAVDKGRVNTRAWVLQERLMSPRVVHFCREQVGWECACRNTAAKSAPSGALAPHTRDVTSQYHAVLGGIRQKMMRNKSVSDSNALTTCSPFELWAAVVNTYSKTDITKPRDRLIAISGLATIIAEETGCAYVAGLWRTHLASQLLWHVEPAFHRSDRTFSHPATFPPEYCAPSFSWAAISTAGHGINYSQITSRGIVVRVDDWMVEPATGDAFGVVLKAQITLHGHLRQARLVSLPKNRFGWYLVGRNDLDHDCHTNVYLDCPTRDTDLIDNQSAYIYVLPVARQNTYAGTTRNEHLICLLLRTSSGRGVFKRVGITKLSPTFDGKAMKKCKGSDNVEYEIMKHCKGDAKLPHDGIYTEGSGMHRLHLI